MSGDDSVADLSRISTSSWDHEMCDAVHHGLVDGVSVVADAEMNRDVDV